jgi:hypothetical protein
MTWTMSRAKTYQIDLQFYSRHGDRIWPGHGEIYVLPGRATRTDTLACGAGASICCGGWPDNASTGASAGR